jgi:hypothetical protein
MACVGFPLGFGVYSAFFDPEAEAPKGAGYQRLMTALKRYGHAGPTGPSRLGEIFASHRCLNQNATTKNAGPKFAGSTGSIRAAIGGP